MQRSAEHTEKEKVGREAPNPSSALPALLRVLCVEIGLVVLCAFPSVSDYTRKVASAFASVHTATANARVAASMSARETFSRTSFSVWWKSK